MLRLKYERQQRGMLQSTLGVVARIQQQRIAQIENGKLTPSANQLARLAAVLRVPPDQLLQPVEVLSVEAAALVKVGRLHLLVARLQEEAGQ